MESESNKNILEENRGKPRISSPSWYEIMRSRISRLINIIPMAGLTILCKSFYQWLFGYENIALINIIFCLNNLTNFTCIVLGLFTSVEIWNFLGNLISRFLNFFDLNFTAYACIS